VNNLKKLQFLDSLRGLAILLVLLVHSGGLAELFGRKLEAANFGQRGVQLFYQLSAFSLLYSHSRRREASFRAFFIRRFFRIAPLFYLSMVANYVATVVIGRSPPLSLAAYASGLSFLFGFHPAMINAVAPAGWSVAVEAIFYAFFPVLAAWVTDLGRALALTAGSMLACFLICYRLEVYPLTVLPAEYVHFLWFPVEFPVFCLGFVGFFAWQELELADLGPRRKAISLGLLLLAAFTVYAGFPPVDYRLYANSLSFAFLIVAVAIEPWRLLVNPATALIGRLSFSIYLIHPYLTRAAGATMDWLERMTTMRLYGSWAGLGVAFAVYLGGSLVLAAVTYRLVELPGIALGKRIISRPAARKPAPAIPVTQR
jgi:peptidoglycan/LPS O-acetylase OafA/YrhL